MGLGVVGRAGWRAGVGVAVVVAAGGCAVGRGVAVGVGLRFAGGLRFVWPTDADDRANKTISDRRLKEVFIPKLRVFEVNVNLDLIRAQTHDWRCLLGQRQGWDCV